MTVDRLAWLPGFFTGQLHAVLVTRTYMRFHGVAIVWSLCGVPAAVVDHDGRRVTCPKCVAIQGRRDQNVGPS